MSDLSRTVKITHNNEVRKLKGVQSFESFLDIIKNKIKIDNFELAYYDEDGDEITISNSDDFDEWIRISQPKVPKIHLKNIEKEVEDFQDLDKAFPGIAMTVSTCEKPGLKRRSSLLSFGSGEIKSVKIANSWDEEELKEEPKEFADSFNVIDSVAFDNAQQTESFGAPELDEKWTSTNHDGILINSSSVQTQSIQKANVWTEVVIPNQDEMMGTDSLSMEDKGNQNEVVHIESANDPIIPEVNDQSVNTIQDEQEEVKNEMKIPDEKLDEILARIVKTQMQELTPILVAECKKFMQSYLEKAESKQIQEDISNHTCDICGENKAARVKYECEGCIAECVSLKKSYCSSRRSKSPVPSCGSLKDEDVKQNENFVSWMSRGDSNNKDSDAASDYKSVHDADVDPIIEEEPIIQEPEEYPEMVKRSVMLEYKPFSDEYIKSLKAKWVFPEDIFHTIQRDTDTFNIEFEALNSDSVNNTRWPIYTTLICLNPDQNEVEKCTAANKEIRAGVKCKFTAKLKTPKNKNKAYYTFSLIDEYGRTFGDQINVKVNISGSDILELAGEEEPSAFEEPHQADKLYPAAVKQLREMGLIEDQYKDLLLKVKGRVELVFEQI